MTKKGASGGTPRQRYAGGKEGGHIPFRLLPIHPWALDFGLEKGRHEAAKAAIVATLPKLVQDADILRWKGVYDARLSEITPERNMGIPGRLNGVSPWLSPDQIEQIDQIRKLTGGTQSEVMKLIMFVACCTAKGGPDRLIKQWKVVEKFKKQSLLESLKVSALSAG